MIRAGGGYRWFEIAETLPATEPARGMDWNVWVNMVDDREFLYQEVNKEAVGRQQDFHIRLA